MRCTNIDSVQFSQYSSGSPSCAVSALFPIMSTDSLLYSKPFRYWFGSGTHHTCTRDALAPISWSSDSVSQVAAPPAEARGRPSALWRDLCPLGQGYHHCGNASGYVVLLFPPCSRSIALSLDMQWHSRSCHPPQPLDPPSPSPPQVTL